MAPGARLGPYEILTAIGRGGMGEVYRAKDTRLKREIAIKILPAHVMSHAGKRQRFQREALAVASLSHPHICAIFDVGSESGSDFLVMEHLVGETLERRLVRGALPVKQLLQYAIEIADALDHAHRHGIVHRDLKPANIMLTQMGVKLLDFGLAKLSDREPVQLRTDGDTLPETLTLTSEGTILGTVQYMAPEQLEGKNVDARADLFAVGAIVYEMATGRRAFMGRSHASLIAAVLTADPPAMATLAPIPPELERIVKKLLVKDAELRWQTARDLLDELRWIAESDAAPAARTQRPRAPNILRHIGVAAVVVVSVTLALVSSFRSPTRRDERLVRFTVSAPEHSTFQESSGFFAVSPDGRALAFGAASPSGKRALWVRSIDSPSVRQVPGTEGGLQPFWSPDSRWLAFLPATTLPDRPVAGEALKKIDPAGGVPAPLVDASGAYIGTWNSSGDVVFMFGPNRAGGLYLVPAGGGTPQPLTTLDQARAEIAHKWPQFLPDGRHFIYVAESRQPELNNVLYVGSLDSTDRIRLVSVDSHAEYAPPGFLLYMRGGSPVGNRLFGGALVAQPFDLTDFRVTGEAVRIAGPVDRSTDFGRGAFSVSQTGVLAYRLVAEMQLSWYDRSGKLLQTLGSGANPALSPDGQRLALTRLNHERTGSTIWLMDASGGNALPLTSGPFVYDMSLWSPDGGRVLFRADAGRGPGISQRASNGTGPEEMLLSPADPPDPMIQPLAWSDGGRSLVYGKTGPTTTFDLATLALSGDRRSAPLFQEESAEFMGSTSSDGHWIAYVSGESGRNEVYVRQFTGGDGKWKISGDGGIEPVWRRDGREIFYVAMDGGLMSVAIRTDPQFGASPPVRLFHTRMSTITTPAAIRNQYLASADGQRFLIREVPEGRPILPITVVVNWTMMLEKE